MKRFKRLTLEQLKAQAVKQATERAQQKLEDLKRKTK